MLYAAVGTLLHRLDLSNIIDITNDCAATLIN
jgi:hypothetical protein